MAACAWIRRGPILQADVQPAGVERKPGKKIVVFADGTGNAFSAQESNIWRLYQALDKQEKPAGLMQIARYVPGVGTSSNAVIRYLDGVTGFGVPSNVRKLYRFLCWNWTPGDEIYVFGFSRGAFTVRTLASMVARQGLMPRQIDGNDVGKAGMKRNAAGAWRAYRSKTAPLVKDGRLKMNPLIEGVRLLRDGIIRLKRAAMRQDQHEAVLAAQSGEEVAGAVRIHFMGVFDTVEAYGMPVKELNRVVNWWLWPIRFRNYQCSPVVAQVRHALALDDERLTFEPLRFDQGPREGGKAGPETQEVWFAGMHSDVGGGYPDNAVSLDPLLWMKDEAAGQGLIFDGLILNRYERARYPQALIHNSRAGLASLYRYAPRKVQGGREHAGPPVLHHSAVRKMQIGADGYAPLTLPGDFRVLPEGAADWSGIVPHGMTRDIGAVEHVRRLIGWRKRTNWLTILCIAGLVLLPLAAWLIGADRNLGPDVAAWVSWLLSGLLPGWAYGWVVALLTWWFVSVPLILAVFGIYMVNESLGDRVRDWARRVWT